MLHYFLKMKKKRIGIIDTMYVRNAREIFMIEKQK